MRSSRKDLRPRLPREIVLSAMRTRTAYEANGTYANASPAFFNMKGEAGRALRAELCVHAIITPSGILSGV
jgi:hypothetical protein